MANKELRKRLFVNRTIQGRLLGRFTCYWLVYHGVLWMAMFLYCYATHRGAMMAGAAPRTFADLYGQFVNEHFSIWICAAAILPIVLWDLLIFSHRVAGPLVRFQHALKSLTAGETISEVRLRNGDLLLDLQNAFNEYLTTLQTLRPADRCEQVIASELRTIASELRNFEQKVDVPRTPAEHVQVGSAPSRSSAEQIAL
ncbi:MAG TPA: hypothetical protein VK137_14000 [Planctomycetaceae bacterium]|nr:hypothetical protein [Planctomycetaceae bacterium]